VRANEDTGARSVEERLREMADECQSGQGMGKSDRWAITLRQAAETLTTLQAERERIHAELDKWQVPRCDNVTLRIEELGAQLERCLTERDA
jgi:hypothetical protein